MREYTHTQFAVVKLGKTVPAFGLTHFANILQKHAYFLGLLKIVRCAGQEF